jgi:hypothetical protein
MDTTEARETRRHRAAQLRERIYLSRAALATVVAMIGSEADAAGALRTLAIALAGTALAMLVAEATATRIVEARALTITERRRLITDALGSLTVGVVPLLLLGAAAVGIIGTATALTAAAAALVLALVVASALAVRSSGLPVGWGLLGLLGEAAIGVAVIALRVAGH